MTAFKRAQTMNHHNDMHEQPASASETAATRSTRRRFTMPLAFGAIAAALLVIGIVPRLHASTALTSQAAAQHALSVSVIKPRSAPAVQELLLPGSVMPYADASIYARTSGYLEHWYADIGARVKAGLTAAWRASPACH